MPYRLNRRVPATGQTTIYESRDDGDFQLGMPASKRFTREGGVIKDTLSTPPLYWIRTSQRVVVGGGKGDYAYGRGVWTSLEDYSVGDVVYDESYLSVYQCIVDNPGSVIYPALDPEHWILFPWSEGYTEPLDTPGTFTWGEAFSACNALNAAGGYGGYTDWRVPNINELVSIMNWGKNTSPTLFSPFESDGGDANYIYISSTTRAASSYDYMGVSFNSNPTIYKKTKTGTPYYCRLVRGGQ